MAPPDAKIHRIQSGDPFQPVEDLVIEARALLMRCDEAFVYTPHLVDPANRGNLEHTFAVEESLLQSGFNVSDPTRVQISADSRSQVWRTLPGGADDTLGSAREKSKRSPYAPANDETKLSYMRRVRDYSYFLLYERADGLVLYRPDPIEKVIDWGMTLARDATFYGTRAQALAAGVPNQVWLVPSEEYTEPVISNIVKIIPCDPSLPQVFCRDTLSVEDPTNENYVGYYVRTIVSAPEMAVDLIRSRLLAVVALRRARRKKVCRVWRCPLPPWRMGSSGFQIGDIAALYGYADYQVVEMEIRGLKHGVYETKLLGERVPTGTVLS
jgi:hypothetical protein